jgi:hypothetical protein
MHFFYQCAPYIYVSGQWGSGNKKIFFCDLFTPSCEGPCSNITTNPPPQNMYTKCVPNIENGREKDECRICSLHFKGVAG